MGMMSNKNFAALILTHGRPNKVITYNTLRKCGYTGKIVIVVDNEDDYANEYINKFGSESVVIFDKLATSKTFDEFDNYSDRRAIVYARNASFDIAKDLGFESFIQLDDDYSSFSHRASSKMEGCCKRIKSLDDIFDAMIYFLKKTNIKTIAMAQGGDFIGGDKSRSTACMYKRKAMNSFMCLTDRRINFVGRINEDVNTYVTGGQRGDIYLTTMAVDLNQCQTQKSNGGMTDIYKENGTYVKSFYTVIASPSSCDIKLFPKTKTRHHHHINWDKTAVKIIREEVKDGINNV